MTYAELFVFVDSLREKFPPRAISVLNHLIARCIVEGSNEIELSIIQLAANLGMSRDPVRDAAIRLEGLIGVRVASGVSMRWILPADWFEPQRSLFTVSTAVDKYRDLTRNQAGTRLETRQVPSEKPGRYLTRNQAGSPGNQAGSPGNQAGSPGNQAGTRLETRQVVQENQRLSDDPRQIRSDQIVSLNDHTLRELDQIISSTTIPVELTREADILSLHLRSWYADNGVEGCAPSGPSKSMLAQTLALAPLETILEKLRHVALPKSGPPRKWLWFLVTLAHQIHGIDSTLFIEALKEHARRKPPQSTTDTFFKHQVLQQVSAAVRKMR